jgi:hypothetical protein
MSDISAGRAKTRDFLQGGVREIYFFTYVADAFTVSASIATAINSSITACYKYEIKGDVNKLSENVVVDKKAGTKVNTQTLVAQLSQINSETNVELDKLLETEVSAVYKDYNGQYRWVADRSFNVTSTADTDTGGARGDFNGYNVTLVAETRDLAPSLDTETVAAFLALAK